MKRVIRRNIFETNSSSTHSITICSSNEYNDFKNGKLLIKYYGNDQLVTKSEALEEISANLFSMINDDEINEILEHDGYLTYDQYMNKINYDYERYFKEYTTKSGDKIVAFGYYGENR